MCRSLLIVRTTTSPEQSPTRASAGTPYRVRASSAYAQIASCIASAA
ncbi:MAG TPA: hypothetical protein VFH48_46235 [Chloroflexota bacterium]|nr:hypothetical protein [Chloroflexota bacterium]